MHSNVQYFPDPLESFTKPFIFHIVKGKPHTSSFDNPWLGIIPPCSTWCVVCVLQSQLVPLVAVRKAGAGSQEMTPEFHPSYSQAQCFPPCPLPGLKGDAAVNIVTCDWADTAGSPVICASDLPCPEKKLSK